MRELWLLEVCKKKWKEIGTNMQEHEDEDDELVSFSNFWNLFIIYINVCKWINGRIIVIVVRMCVLRLCVCKRSRVWIPLALDLFFSLFLLFFITSKAHNLMTPKPFWATLFAIYSWFCVFYDDKKKFQNWFIFHILILV